MKVHCQYSDLVLITKLQPHPKNPNNHTKAQIKQLAKILDYQGWRAAVKVSKRSGFVTSGHGRIEAAQLNGWEAVPVSFQDYESDEQEYADLVADNAIGQQSMLSLENINSELANLGPDLDLDCLGLKDFLVDAADKPQMEECPACHRRTKRVE